jgi:hypothetical protein
MLKTPLAGNTLREKFRLKPYCIFALPRPEGRGYAICHFISPVSPLGYCSKRLIVLFVLPGNVIDLAGKFMSPLSIYYKQIAQLGNVIVLAGK